MVMSPRPSIKAKHSCGREVNNTCAHTSMHAVSSYIRRLDAHHHKEPLGDSCRVRRGTHTNDLNDTPIDLLPNELLVRILPAPCVSALVCSRWRDITDAHLAKGSACLKDRRTRSVCVSMVLDMCGDRSLHGIQIVLRGLLGNVTLAHLLPLLIATGRPEHATHAIKLWSGENHCIDRAEAAAWIDAHRSLESRFDAAWPDNIQPRFCLDCDHKPTHMHAIASCVLLSVAARHTRCPIALGKFALFCRTDERALRKALALAAASDRRDVLGALLCLYAQHLEGNAARCPTDKGPQPLDRNSKSGSHNGNVLEMFQTLYIVVGTYGSLECAETLDLFLYRDDVEPQIIMSPSWSDRIDAKPRRTISLARADRNMARTLTALNDAVFGRTVLLGERWLSAAIAADRPEMLDLYLSHCDRSFGQHPDLADAARAGKIRFSHAIMARCPRAVAGYWRDRVNNWLNFMPFTLEGIRWIATQAWYHPCENTIRRVLDDLFCESTSVCHPTRMERLSDAIDALGIMADMWPERVRASLRDKRDRIGALLVASIVRGASLKERDLFEALAEHLDNCGLIETDRSGSIVERVWAYLADIAVTDAAVGTLLWERCDPCVRDTPMALVFVALLNRHKDTPPAGDSGTLDRLALAPLSYECAIRAFYGRMRYISKEGDVVLDSSLARLAYHGLLKDAPDVGHGDAFDHVSL